MGACTSSCRDQESQKNGGHFRSTASNASTSSSREPPVAVSVSSEVRQAPALKYTIPNVVIGIPAPEQGRVATSVLHASESNASVSGLPGQPLVVKSSAVKASTGNHPSKRVPSVSSKEHVSESKINSLFCSYCSESDDSILADGIERFCQDLDIKPDDFRILVLAWKFNANVMCCFTRQEFTTGCKKIKADSVSGIQARMPELLLEVKEKTAFRTFYRWAFRFALDSDAGQRTLPLDIALQLWPLVFSQNEPRILRSWLEYLQKHQSLRGIPRDTWDMFLNFTECVKDGFANYDDTEAWPSLFDNFVEYETDRQNQNVEESPSVE